METIRKTIRILRLVLGWLMTILGALACAACLVYFVMALMGKLEIPSVIELIMTAALLMSGVLLFWHVCFWGLRVKDVPELPEEEEDPPTEKKPEPEAAEPAASSAPAEEVPAAPEMLPDMPALAVDPQPFAAYEREESAHDSLEDRSEVAAYFLLLEGASVRDAVEQYLNNGRLSRPIHIRICDQSVLDGLEEGFLRKCEENEIRLVEYEGAYHVYDHVGKRRYTATITNWPDGTDEAGTYGYWSFG